MKYAGMPAGMWLLFSGSFKKRLVSVLKYDARTAGEITARAKGKYKQIIASVPEFEKADRFKMNLVNGAMLASFLLNAPNRPTVEQATVYYREAMMTGLMRLFCRMSGKKKFSDSDIAGLKKAAALNPADRNPYSWNMEYLPYADGSGYEARFSACGICVLMKELGLYDLVPAMCRLDYTMSEAGGASIFVREYTLASGDPYCDCGYKRRNRRHPGVKEDEHS